jgi:hypothetical protein
MRLLAVLAVSVPLAAQLQVAVVRDGGAEAAGASINLGATGVGESADTRIRATNAGTAAINISSVAVNGAAFSLAQPFQPFPLGPNTSYEFTIRFAPPAPGSYSAVLTVGPFTSIVRATAVLAADVSLVRGGQAILLPPSGLSIDAVAGENVVIELALSNPHSSPLAIEPLLLSGAGFRLTAGSAGTLAPGDAAPISIAFSAQNEGTYAATLTAGARRFAITAFVTKARLKPPRIVSDSPVVTNGKQVKIRLRFEEAIPVASAGTLRATFAGAFADPAIQFQNGSREIGFTVAAGATEAQFGASAEAVLQTGTTNGVIRVEATTESGTTVETWTLARAPIAVDQAEARRDGSNLEITLTGYDNTRTAGSANFRFFDRAGNAIGGIITAQFAPAFETYFAQSAVGGAFRLRATFPVTGDATMVGSVLVEIANAVGRTDLQRINFP